MPWQRHILCQIAIKNIPTEVLRYLSIKVLVYYEFGKRFVLQILLHRSMTTSSRQTNVPNKIHCFRPTYNICLRNELYCNTYFRTKKRMNYSHSTEAVAGGGSGRLSKISFLLNLLAFFQAVCVRVCVCVRVYVCVLVCVVECFTEKI